MELGRDAAPATPCPGCGAGNPPGAHYCNRCGSPLGSRAAAMQEERKLVSVLFVDLVGFTSQADGADPEDVRDALRVYHARAREVIEEYAGTLEKFIGDAVMAVFGAPVAHGDDAERAVRAGLRLLDEIGDLNRKHRLELAARAAVNTGEAVVSLGGHEAGEALAMGDVVNTASRLQEAAPVGHLVVGVETHRATRHVIRYEPLPPVAAKGKAEPVRAWRALEPTTGPAERPMTVTPVVGRDRELELVQSLWTRALSDRRPHLVTLLGPPGIGKSRLCKEVAAIVEGDRGRIVRGRCLPYEEQFGYQAFAHLTRTLAGIPDADPPEKAREKLESTVHELLPTAQVADTSRYLALLLGVAAGDSVDEPRLLFYAARRFVEALGQQAPTLLVFEDLHWARPSELQLLEYLASHVRDTSVLLVVTARPELLDVHPTWGSGLVAQTTILLEPLESADAERLAEHLARSLATPLDVARLIETAEGNPLFLEELVASISELGHTEDLPVTVREAIAARIDVLPADVRATLLSAAVIGKTFWRGVLDAIIGDSDVDASLAELEARGLVSREAGSQLGFDTEYAFRHMLIREVAYATVPRAMRRERHARVARYIEETIDHSSETLAWVLAYHWREAGEPTRAIPYLVAAADVALGGWAQGAVVDLLTTALELADAPELRTSIRLRRALARVRLEEYEIAARELAELLPELDGRDRLDALLGLGRATHWTERDAETIEAARHAVALAEARAAVHLAEGLEDEGSLAAALALESQAHAMRGERGDIDRALDLGERALELWPAGARSFDLAEHLHLFADTNYWVGRYERCAELSRQARGLADDVRSAEALLRGGGTEALALAGLGRHEEAIEIWDELLAIAHELGRSPGVLLNYSALAYRELLDLDEARARSERALELTLVSTFGMPRRFAQSDLLFTDLLAGDIGRAQAAWPELWRDAADSTAWTRWLIYGRLATARAEIALAAEPPETAIEWTHRALNAARTTRRRKYESRALGLLGETLVRLGRRDEAIRELRASVALADELVGPPARWSARAALGRAAFALGEDDVATTAYAEAAELVATFAATLKPERATRLLRAPAVAELLGHAGRSPSEPAPSHGNAGAGPEIANEAE